MSSSSTKKTHIQALSKLSREEKICENCNKTETVKLSSIFITVVIVYSCNYSSYVIIVLV